MLSLRVSTSAMDGTPPDRLKGATMKVTIKKTTDYNPFGYGEGKWHGFAYVDSKRIGTVWRFRDRYICNEDFDSRKHSRENRPMQFKGRTLADLKADIAARF